MEDSITFSNIKISHNALVATQFILLATVFNFTTIENKNYLLILFSSIVIIVVSLNTYRNSVNWVNQPIWLVFLYMSLSCLINIHQTEILSFLYSTFFILSFAFFYKSFKENINLQYFKKILVFIFFIYLLTLFLGQLYVFLGYLPAHNDSEILNLHGSFGSLFTSDGFTYRYYSLSSEPSYASFIIISIMFCYFTFIPKEKVFSRKNLMLWLSTLYMIYFFKSGFGILLFGILLMKYLSLKNIALLIVISALLTTIILSVDLELTSITRVSNVISRLSISNLSEIRNIDYSASFRIMPIIIYLKEFNLCSLHYYLGHGAGEASTFFVPFLFESSKVSEFNGGFIPAFFYDYGLIGGLLTIVIVKHLAIRTLFSFESVIFALLLLNANFNTQLFWFLLFLFALKKYYTKNIKANTSQSKI